MNRDLNAASHFIEPHERPRYRTWMISLLTGAAWAPLLVFLVYAYCRGPLDLYRLYPQFDVIAHCAGGGAIAYFFHRASITASRCGVMGAFHPLTHVLLVFGLTCAAAVFWEFAEHWSLLVNPRRGSPQLVDMVEDLAYGIACGTLLISILARRLAQARRSAGTSYGYKFASPPVSPNSVIKSRSDR